MVYMHSVSHSALAQMISRTHLEKGVLHVPHSSSPILSLEPGTNMLIAPPPLTS